MGNIYGALRRRFSRVAVTFLATIGLLAAPFAAITPAATAQAVPPNSKPWNIATGSDGALWFTELDANKIGRITTGGTITEYTVPTANAAPYGITAGPDGAMWFTENNVSKIGRIAMDGTFTEYDAPRNANNDEVKPTDIGKAFDGSLWYASIGSIGKITTDGTATRYPLSGQYSNKTVTSLTGGQSGIWFVIPSGDTPSDIGAIGHVPFGGGIVTYPFLRGITITDISDGPQDGVWFTSISKNGGQPASSMVWRLAEDGSIFTPYTIPVTTTPSQIANGILGAGPSTVWYASRDNNTVAHFMRGQSPDVVTQLASGSCPQGLTKGSDNAMWFTEACSNKIGRVDANGNLTEYPITGIPSAPTGLHATSPATQASLAWTVSPDAASYNVYRNGTLIGNTSNTTYLDSPTSGNYSYYVKAVGSGGLESDPSNTINVVVATAPLVTITNPTNNSTVSGTVSVTGTVYSASTYSRSFYIFNSSGQAVGSQYQFAVPNSTTTMSYTWDTTQVPNGVYTLNLSARDSQGNKDANSTSVVKVTVQN
jgi:virginiamycin B lyase